MIDNHKDQAKDWVGCNEEEYVIEKRLEIERKALESCFVLSYKIERSNIGYKCSEKHIYLED